MSVAAPPFESPRVEPPRSCPRCDCELRGARLCEVCGAADFDGEGVWICFACGEGNAKSDDRCGRCAKTHTICCPACGREGHHRDVACEFCGAARALYPVIVRLLAEAARGHSSAAARGRSGATIAALIAVVSLSGAALFGAAGKRLEAFGAGGAAGLSSAFAWILRDRRAPNGPLRS